MKFTRIFAGYSIDVPLMLFRQHQISIVVVANPARYNIKGTSMR